MSSAQGSDSDNDEEEGVEVKKEQEGTDGDRKTVKECDQDFLAAKGTVGGGMMLVNVAEDDDLDMCLQLNLSVFREKSFSKFSDKAVRKTFLKLVIEGDVGSRFYQGITIGRYKDNATDSLAPRQAE